MASVSQQMAYPLKSLLDGFSVKEMADDITVNGLSIDSREINDGYLFVAVQGVTKHGKHYIPQAVKKGACAILIDTVEEPINCAVPVIAIDNLQSVLSEVAGRFYQHPSDSVPVYGITGTNGKTTCSHLLAQCLAIYEGKCGVMGTLGYGLMTTSSANDEPLIVTGMTTADPISTQKMCADLLADDAQAIVMEVSSHGLQQNRVEGVDINTAVFTNLTHDHLDYHGTMHAYGQAKAQLFEMPSVTNAVINQDDEFSEQLIEKLNGDASLITYSLSNTISGYTQSSAHFSFEESVFSSAGVASILNTPKGQFPITTQLVGAFNLSNLLAVIGALYANNYSVETIVASLSSLKPVPGRMELISNTLGFQVVVDFAHTPDALKSALEALAHHQHNKIWCVFGCGGDRDSDKRSKMATIAETLADYVVVTNDNPRTESPENIFADIKQGFSCEHTIIENRAGAIAYAIESAGENDIVLIAGKGHEDYQILGSEKIQFSDQQQARLNLRKREQEMVL